LKLDLNCICHCVRIGNAEKGNITLQISNESLPHY
jgi:hypothetical protein